MKTEEIFFTLAGEQSADNYWAVLMHYLKKLKPNAEFAGIGGFSLDVLHQ